MGIGKGGWGHKSKEQEQAHTQAARGKAGRKKKRRDTQGDKGHTGRFRMVVKWW